ncbi:hypothetical protein TNCV_2719471 [Trichonephila clavipes]|nr:hypothetical protein TNCV_2719471 [Trichonephila clavipes]
MFDPSSFANPTLLAHANTSKDVLPRGGTSQAYVKNARRNNCRTSDCQFVLPLYSACGWRYGRRDVPSVSRVVQIGLKYSKEGLTNSTNCFLRTRQPGDFAFAKAICLH